MNTKTCADVMALCCQRLAKKRGVNYIALGQAVSTAVEKMEGASIEDIANEVLSGRADAGSPHMG